MEKAHSTQPDNIPTLTEVVKTANGGEKEDVAQKKPVMPQSAKHVIETSSGGVDINRNELEKLIYKKLHQQLPQICRSLAEDIIGSLSSGTDAGSGKNGKPIKKR